MRARSSSMISTTKNGEHIISSPSSHRLYLHLHFTFPSPRFSFTNQNNAETNRRFPNMANSKRLFGVVRRNLLRRSPSIIRSAIPDTTREHIAAIKIQAFFRGHLARRAFRALKSLVKLQAVARGVLVRRQARIALHCMHALARLQVRVRARQILSN